MRQANEQQSLASMEKWPRLVDSVNDGIRAWQARLAQIDNDRKVFPERIFEQEIRPEPIPSDVLEKEARRLYGFDHVSEEFYRYERKLDDTLAFLADPSQQRGVEMERLRRTVGLFNGMYSASINQTMYTESDDGAGGFIKFCGGRLQRFIEQRYQDPDCPVYEHRLLEELEMVNLAYSLGIDAVDVPVIETEAEKVEREKKLVKVYSNIIISSNLF